jgi:hypothetical protein
MPQEEAIGGPKALDFARLAGPDVILTRGICHRGRHEVSTGRFRREV